jgi:hypothetical protein
MASRSSVLMCVKMAMLLVLGLTVLCIICDDERVTWEQKIS